LLEESGVFKHMMNTLPGSPGMQAVGEAVQSAILEEFEAIETQGGVLGAVERRYQRSQIQGAAHVLESQISNGTRPIIGLNRYALEDLAWPDLETIRTPAKKKKVHQERVEEFHRRHAGESEKALDRLAAVVEHGGNTFSELINCVEHCSLGQITARLTDVVGRFRPMV
jgi:methylmalonyl-CoA mutase